MNRLSFVFLALGFLAVQPQHSYASSGQKIPTEAEIRAYYDQSSLDWEDLPRAILMVFVAAEDRFFFERELRRSTITRALAALFVSPAADARATQSKFSEVIASSLTHDEVLEWYVNRVYLGLGCYGAAAASTAYFDAGVDEVELAEAAYLAALAKAPTLFHPVKHLERATKRRNFVLREMQRGGFISENERHTGVNSRLIVRDPLGECAKSPAHDPPWMQ